MKEIELTTQNQISIVDDDDFEKVNQYKWYAHYCPDTKSFYAERSIRIKDKVIHLTMHRFIMGLEKGNKLQVDHINHDTLDNRKQNLKIVTERQNKENKKNNSKYGVNISYDKRLKKKPYALQITLNGTRCHLGLFATIDEAQKYREKYKKENSL